MWTTWEDAEIEDLKWWLNLHGDQLIRIFSSDGSFKVTLSSYIHAREEILTAQKAYCEKLFSKTENLQDL